MDGWQDAFVSVTVGLGDTVDDARASLDARDALVAEKTLRALTHPDRGTRARALAAQLAQLVIDLDGARLW